MQRGDLVAEPREADFATRLLTLMNLRPVVNWAWCISLENDLPGAPAKSRESLTLFSFDVNAPCPKRGITIGRLTRDVRESAWRRGSFPGQFSGFQREKESITHDGTLFPLPLSRVVLRARDFNMGLMTLVCACICVCAHGAGKG